MEKFMRKMWKKSEGFTLVELIVVIAILGILAAVAVPAYSGYLDKAKESSDMQTLASVATAVAGSASADGITISTITVTHAGVISATTASGAATLDTDEIYDLIGVADADALEALFKADWSNATMSGGKWTLE